MKSAKAGLAILGALLYPVFAYFAYDTIPPRILALILMSFLGLRLVWIYLRGKKVRLPWRAIMPFVVVSVIASLIVFFAQSNEVLLHIPVLVQVMLFGVFAFGFIKPPTIIEGFAKMDFPVLPPNAVAYCRIVTLVWCGVFLACALITEWVVMTQSKEVWLFWTSMGLYLFMGFIFAIEFACRKMIEPQFKKALADMEAAQSN